MASVYILLNTLSLVLWNFLASCEGRYYYPMPTNRKQYARQEDDFFNMDILMPGIIPNKPEEYICYAAAAPRRDAYIVNFKPVASMKTIHHMLIYGCTDIPDDVETAVPCEGSPCSGKSNIMFGWARDAESPNIPEGVGFHVGGSSGINYINIQLHYGDNLDHLQGTSGDHSGISLVMTHTPQPFIGGIYLLWSGSIHIPPRSTNVHADIACKYDSSANIHPFAFRTHAHGLGKVITGYLIRNGEWTVIAKGSPKWPQAFYPMDESYTIQPGDILAARCTYDSGKDVATHAGGTHTDEMCNLYLMYYTDATRGEAFQECGRPAPSSFFSSAPLGSNSPPAHIPYTSQAEPHSRFRPAPVNPWDYNVYDDTAGYYTGPQSYGDTDYNPPTGDSGDPGLGTGESRGGEDQGDEVQTEKPAEEAPGPGGEEGGPPVPSSQNFGGTNDGAATQDAPIEAPEASKAPDRSQTFVVSDVDGWPSSSSGVTLGQVSGVAVDSHGNVHIFHRASRPWDVHSFNGDVFSQPARGPIANDTVIKYDSSKGAVLSQWGANQFYLPHGLTIDHEDNIWLTDVAMHQVFKYPPGGGDTPLLTLGQKLEPGNDNRHFCKPSDVTVDPKTGNFFVSDGYCNARVMKFSPEGKLLFQWGHQLLNAMSPNPSVGQFNLPHCITMVTDKNQVCVADREVGRIQCFNADSGDFTKQFNLPEFGGRLYAVAYTSASGGLIYAVNGPSVKKRSVRGFAINFTSSEILRMWKPQSQEFEKPHDIACTPDGRLVYVAEIGPNKVWQFKTNADNSTEFKSLQSQADQVQALKDKLNSGVAPVPMGTTTIIVAVLAVPILLMLLVAISIRMHAQGHFRLRKKKKNYKVTAGDKFSLGSLLHKRNGFSQIATEDSDPDAAQWSEESDIEEYSILNNTKRTQNL